MDIFQRCNYVLQEEDNIDTTAVIIKQIRNFNPNTAILEYLEKVRRENPHNKKVIQEIIKLR